MPADVFAALEDIEFPFLRERLEAEFKSNLHTTIQPSKSQNYSLTHNLEFNEVQTTKRTTYRRKVAAAKKAEKEATTDPNASMMSTATTATTKTEKGSASGPRASKKQKISAPDDSAMDVDDPDATQDPREISDAETEPEQEHEEEEEENEGGEEEEEEEEEGEGNEDEEHDRLEVKEAQEEHDDALDDGDSDWTCSPIWELRIALFTYSLFPPFSYYALGRRPSLLLDRQYRIQGYYSWRFPGVESRKWYAPSYIPTLRRDSEQAIE